MKGLLEVKPDFLLDCVDLSPRKVITVRFKLFQYEISCLSALPNLLILEHTNKSPTSGVVSSNRIFITAKLSHSDICTLLSELKEWRSRCQLALYNPLTDDIEIVATAEKLRELDQYIEWNGVPVDDVDGISAMVQILMFVPIVRRTALNSVCFDTNSAFCIRESAAYELAYSDGTTANGNLYTVCMDLTRLMSVFKDERILILDEGANDTNLLFGDIYPNKRVFDHLHHIEITIGDLIEIALAKK